MDKESGLTFGSRPPHLDPGLAIFSTILELFVLMPYSRLSWFRSGGERNSNSRNLLSHRQAQQP